MEFGCSACEYTSTQKRDIVRHINRKISCNPGIKEIVEIPVDIKCEYCSKEFTTTGNLKYHQKHNCKNRKDQLEEENKILKEKVKELEKRPTTINDNSTTFNIIVVNNYENTDLSKLTDKTYNKILVGADEAHQIIPRLLKEIHFNPNIPENHNICLSNRNKNNKHLQVYRNGHMEIVDKDTEIDNLISDKETNLSDWVAEKGEMYPEAKEVFTDYLDQKYEDEYVLKQTKKEVELVLYNNKHMVTS